MPVLAPFPIDELYTGVTLAYRNTSLIADSVLPRVLVGKKEFKHMAYTRSEAYTVPNTLVGRKGAPNEVDFTASEVPSFTYDYGLDDVVPNDDVTNAPAGYDPLGRAVEGLTDLVLLDREIRVANTIFSAANYPSGYKVTLSGTSQWSDYTNSNPVKAILDALDVPLYRPNKLVLGQSVFTTLRQHPKVVAAVFGTGGNAANGGMVSKAQLEALFELSIDVGSSYLNSAKPGQSATMARVWGKHAALLHINPLADTNRGITFGYTAQFGNRIAGTMAEPKVGLRGAVRVRVGESVRELVAASDVAYYFENAIA